MHGTHIEQAKQDDVHENRNQSVNTQSTDTATETGIDDKIYYYNNNENNSNDKILLMLSAFATNYYLIPTFNGCFSRFSTCAGRKPLRLVEWFFYGQDVLSSNQPLVSKQ